MIGLMQLARFRIRPEVHYYHRHVWFAKVQSVVDTIIQMTRLRTAKCHRHIHGDWEIDIEKAKLEAQMLINLPIFLSFLLPVEHGSEVKHVPHNHRNLNNSDWKQCKIWKYCWILMNDWTFTLSAALYSNTLLIVSLKKMFKIKFYIIKASEMLVAPRI